MLGIIDVSGQNHRALFADIINQHITGETTMLDVGCGFADHLAKYSRGAKCVYGVDFNEKMVTEAAAIATDITIMLMNTRNLAYKDGLFHVVTSVFNPMDMESIREVHRVLNA